MNQTKSRVHYFSSYHFARDLYGTLVPFTFFIALAIFLRYDEVVFRLKQISISSEYFTGLVVIFIPSYVFIGAMAGMISRGLFFIFYDRWREKHCDQHSYEKYYSNYKKELENLFSTHIPKKIRKNIWGNRLDCKVDCLCHYMKQANPDGYIHAYRTYSFVYVFEQSIVYLALLIPYIFVTDIYEWGVLDEVQYSDFLKWSILEWHCCDYARA